MPCFDNSGHTSDRPTYEEELCRARWVLFQVIGHSTGLPRSLKKEVARERRDHLLHRRKDKELLVENRECDLSEIEDKISDIESNGGSPKAGLIRKLEKAKNEFRKAKIITDAKLIDTCWHNPE